MKIINIFLSLLLTQIIFCVEESNYVVFSNEEIKASDGINISGTTVTKENPGMYIISGEAEEGNIIVKSNKVSLFLQNLKLASKNSPNYHQQKFK